MKKLTSIVLSALVAASVATVAAVAVSAADYVVCEVKEGKCELIDNSETNDQASGHALCFAEAYGTGRTTQGDAVKFAGVEFKKDVKKAVVKCGYNLGGDKAGTATQFWVYLDKIEGEPIAKVEVSDSETASSQIVDQVFKYADVDVKAGTYDVYVVGETEYSGSFSQVGFVYEGGEFDENWKEAAKAKEEAMKNGDFGFVQCVVKEGECELVDNSETNDQASGHALCFAEAYGTGRTTQGDAVKFADVKFDKKVTKLAVKCGYNLGGDKAGTATQFWVYLDKIEGEPIAKVEVSDSETASSQIVDQVLKYADVEIEPGTYTVIVVGETEYSGSFSQVNFAYEDTEDLEEAIAAKKAFDDAAKEAEREAEKKAKEEEAAKKKAEEEAKKKEEEEAAKKAEEEAAKKAAEEEEAAKAAAEAEAAKKKNGIIWGCVAAVVVIAAIVAIALGSKKKKNA